MNVKGSHFVVDLKKRAFEILSVFLLLLLFPSRNELRLRESEFLRNKVGLQWTERERDGQST